MATERKDDLREEELDRFWDIDALLPHKKSFPRSAETDPVALEIPALVVLNALFPLYGLAYAQLCAEVVLAATAVMMLRRIFRDAERRQQLS